MNKLAALLLIGTMLGCDRAPDASGPMGSQAYVQPVTPTVQGKFHFLALGDSYTIGETVDPSQRWPVQLSAALRKDGIDISDPTILARTGWTTVDLLSDMAQVDLPKNNDIVGLLIGVNNEFQGRDPEVFRTEFVALLGKAASLSSGGIGRVFVLSIPDWGVMPFGVQSHRSGIGVEIDRFNAIAKTETEKAGAVWVDITPISRRATEDASLIAVDGLHPSGTQYAQWAGAAKPVVAKMLGKN